jgi:hypothetical protein
MAIAYIRIAAGTVYLMEVKMRVDCSYLPTSALRRTQNDGCFVYDHVTSSQPCQLIMGESFRPGSERFSLALLLRQARPRQYGDFLPSHLYLVQSPDLLAWIWWGQRPRTNSCSNFIRAEILSIRREVSAVESKTWSSEVLARAWSKGMGRNNEEEMVKSMRT